ncbi:ribosomal protein S18-alanine N-acetyltransferase [soil metagenome]
MGGDARPTAAEVSVEQLIIRAAAGADLADVAAIELACFSSDPWPRESFEAFLGRAGVTFIVAEDSSRGGRIAGYAVLIRAADEAELLNLAVPEDSRRRGLGSALVRRILESAAEQGVAAVYLEVRESNAAARRLYESLGFAEVGRRRRYYQRPVEDALILRRVREKP